MNYCDNFKESFSGYIENELATDARQVLESHLSICPECRETVQRLRYLRNSLNNFPLITTSSEFESNLNYRLRNLKRRRIDRASLSYFQDWRIPAFGFVIILVVFSFFMLFEADQGKLDMAEPPQKSGIAPTIPVEDKTIIDEINEPEKSTQPVANTPADPASLPFT